MAMDLAIDLQNLWIGEPISTEITAALKLHLVKNQDIAGGDSKQLGLQAPQAAAVRKQTREIAHELNNVLTIIYGQADLIAQSFETNNPLMANVSSIKAAGNRAADLVHELNVVNSLDRAQTPPAALENSRSGDPKNQGFPFLQPWKFENWGFQ